MKLSARAADLLAANAGSLPQRPVTIGLDGFVDSIIRAVDKRDSATEFTTLPTITVQGLNFVRRSMVHFKGKPIPTQVVSPTEIRFTLDAEALRTPGRFEFVVVNPAPVAPFGETDF